MTKPSWLLLGAMIVAPIVGYVAMEVIPYDSLARSDQERAMVYVFYVLGLSFGLMNFRFWWLFPVLIVSIVLVVAGARSAGLDEIEPSYLLLRLSMLVPALIGGFVAFRIMSNKSDKNDVVVSAIGAFGAPLAGYLVFFLLPEIFPRPEVVIVYFSLGLVLGFISPQHWLLLGVLAIFLDLIAIAIHTEMRSASLSPLVLFWRSVMLVLVVIGAFVGGRMKVIEERSDLR